MSDQPAQPHLQDAVIESVLADNLADIAGYTVEKHGFIDDTPLSPEQSKEAEEFILRALWSTVNDRRKRRLTILEKCFNTADEILKEVVKGA